MFRFQFHSKKPMYFLLLAGSIVCSSPINWDMVGNGFAKSTISKGDEKTTLSSSNSGAQFSYTKTGNATGLYTVYLVSNNQKWDLQTGFDVIAQKCSCYFLDISTSFKSHPDIGPGDYSIMFESETEQIISGLFELKLPKGSGKDTSASFNRSSSVSTTTTISSASTTSTPTNTGVKALLRSSSTSSFNFGTSFLFASAFSLLLGFNFNLI